MKSSWRIKKVSNGFGTYYVVQKRFLGFLWWYNPEFTRLYGSLEDARNLLKRKATPTTIEYIDIKNKLP